jgi:signal transduction histidine kinase
VNVRLLFLLPALLLGVIPIVGYINIQSTAQSLNTANTEDRNRQALVLKNFIEADPGLLENPGIVSNQPSLYVNQATTSVVELDGRLDEWQQVRPVTFGRDQLVQINFPYKPSSLVAELRLQQTDSLTFLFLSVNDDVVVYREISNISIHRNDHVRLSMLDTKGNFQRYTVATEQPGRVFARVVSTGGRSLRPEPRIEGFWRAMDNGYQLELAIPNDLLGNQLAFNVADVDDFNTRDIQYMLGNGFTDSADGLSYLTRGSQLLPLLFKQLGIDQVEFLDRQGNLIASRNRSASVAPMIKQAVYLKDQLVGSIQLEVDHSGVTEYLRSAYQQLTLISTAALLFGFVLCYWLAGQFLGRLRLLGQDLEAVVDDQGRVLKAMPETTGNDEISELSKRFTSITRRLQQYNEYLENLSRRLAHELRTPVSVVRSSLEQLESKIPAEDIRFVERAQNGVARLTNILNSMSEAARLEEGLDQNEVSVFELTNVLRGCYEGYDTAFPNQPFELSIETGDMQITGIADLFAQMLDKLVDNAVQFSADQQPVILRLTSEEDMAVLRITNSGPSLPDTMTDQLFDPMISVRDDGQRKDSHLGLGLHVARIIVEFHGGEITLGNRQDREGVVVSVRLPLMRLTSKLV